jgi:hypothetical protein
VDKRLVVANADDVELLAGLRALELPMLSEGEGLRGYEYLLRMRIDRLKAAAVTELTAELAAAVAARDKLAATTTQTLWLTDLDEFVSAWTSYSAERTSVYSATSAGSAAGGAASGKKRGAAAPSKKAVAAKA